MTGMTLFRNAQDSVGFSAGTTLFVEGEHGDQAYVVVEGELEVRCRGNVVGKVGPGEIVGEMALLNSSPRGAECRAITDVRVVPIDQRRFTFLIQQTPFFAIEVMRIMAERLRSANARVST